MPTTRPSTRSAAPPKVTGLGAWEKLGIHTITLPSGAVVRIRIPDLSLLLAGDAVPEQLRGAALQEIAGAFQGEDGGGASSEAIAKLAADEETMNALVELYRWLVTETVIEPVITADDLERLKIPSEDLVMITEFAGRRRNVDARGVTLGVEPIDRWEIWRQAHACPEECAHCAEVIRDLSTSFGE